ncbi:hypothetical protein NDI49_23060 [Trichocoleus sp. ST-U3]|uniref:hypothetical protein n=1 Tax=Coleofasciculus sp. FACHB-542 TaxID=2692787 RepID=UPI001689AD4A|nr:hypothetical protein [Coleofasciculus sp. FACHB-542]MBD2085880.1 hypothetical protein [Coleofasciculus sp. FACHB-542]
MSEFAKGENAIALERFLFFGVYTLRVPQHYAIALNNLSWNKGQEAIAAIDIYTSCSKRRIKVPDR